MDWAEYAVAFGVFLLSHAVPLRPPVKAWLVGHVGQVRFQILYSLLSVLVLWWLIAAAGRAPHVGLWEQQAWQVHVPLIAMMPTVMILALMLGRPNPFSFGGAHEERFDPARPGLVRFIRHPVLVALIIWALAHMVPNGDLAHVLLFGGFAAFAMLGTRMIDRRKARQMGQESWDDLWRQTRSGNVSVRDVWSTPRVVIALAAYMALIVLHPLLSGVSILDWIL